MTLTIALAGVVGILLGLMGGGGSILTVPLLMYVGGMGARAAIGVSLLVIGVSSIAALVPHAIAGDVRWRVGAIFGGAGMIGAFLGARVAGFIPEAFLIGGFGVMMVFTAVALFRCRTCDGDEADQGKAPAGGKVRLMLQGLGVGLLTGMVGVGGGFIIVPTLTLFSRLPTRAAVGTSLMVISLSSLAGFTGHAAAFNTDARFVAGLIGACATGSVIGSVFADRIPQRILRRGFAAMVMAVAVFGFLGPTLLRQSSDNKKGEDMFFSAKTNKDSDHARQLVANGAALIDVRTPEEFAEGHLPGAINIPVDQIEHRSAEIGDSTRPVVVYCRSGARSERAKATLEGLGFVQVVNLGPKSAW